MAIGKVGSHSAITVGLNKLYNKTLGKIFGKWELKVKNRTGTTPQEQAKKSHNTADAAGNKGLWERKISSQDQQTLAAIRRELGGASTDKTSDQFMRGFEKLESSAFQALGKTGKKEANAYIEKNADELSKTMGCSLRAIVNEDGAFNEVAQSVKGFATSVAKQELDEVLSLKHEMYNKEDLVSSNDLNRRKKFLTDCLMQIQQDGYRWPVFKSDHQDNLNKYVGSERDDGVFKAIKTSSNSFAKATFYNHLRAELSLINEKLGARDEDPYLGEGPPMEQNF